MKIVIDEKIPYLKESLEAMGHCVTAMSGDAISHDDVVSAGALFVRTRTKCNEKLLGGTAVRFIGTATIGHDHIDKEFCKRAGIVWRNAAGCNADAVLQYVQSVIYSCCLSPAGLSLGVVGVGEIGSRVARWAEQAGMVVYRNDPPRSLAGETGLVTLDEIAEKCDIITFHPLLERGGEFPTYHLAGKEFFASLKRCKLLVNASRGEVVDNAALLSALKNGTVGIVALDVWENEPEINKELLDRAFVATPHIAGYSAEGKMNATRMVLEAFVGFSGFSGELPLPNLPVPENNVIAADSEREAMLSIYSPMADTAELKEKPENFELLRNNYNLRRETKSYVIMLK